MADMKHFIFGEFREGSQDLSLEEGKIFFNGKRMKERVLAFAEVPLDDVLSLLARVGKRLTEKGRYRDHILEIMPRITGYSLPMMEKALAALAGLLSRESLEERLSCLGDRRALDGWTVHQGKSCRALPLGAVCHVAPGNIFLGAIDSVITGMITKNINVLKLSRQDPVFPFIFLEALLEEDKPGKIASTLALTSWNHSNKQIMELVGGEFDGILLFGGEDAVREYSKITAPENRLLAFGPKLSWGLIRDGLTEKELDSAISGFALDIALWEQKACTSCQNIFVEGEELALKVAEKLHLSLNQLDETLPQEAIDPDEGVDIRKERERVFWQSFQGKNQLLEGNSHSVILGRGGDITPSPLNRTIYVNAIDNWLDLVHGNMGYMSDHMSTAGVAVPAPLFDETLRGLEPLAVPRFCLPGTMGLGVDGGAPHDGSYMILGLVRLVSREDVPLERLGRFYDTRQRRDERLLAELNRLVDHAMKSEFYKRLYADVKLPLTSLGAFAQLPVLEKKHLEKHCPPGDTAMLTASPGASYIFSSGGTSGVPRHICWTAEEFRQAHCVLGQGLCTLGISSKDRVANLMRAGSLYTGFLAMNGGLEQTGCQILSLTANQSIDDTLVLLEELKPNVAMGMTSTLVELAEKVNREKREIYFDRIFYTGEAMSDASRQLLVDVFKSSKVGSLAYGAVEIGTLGSQCEHCKHDEFHLSEDWAYLEIDKEGDVFATATARLLHPIIRYRIGDRAAWVDEPCGCGRTGPKFRLLGRSEYYLRLLYNDLYMTDIERTLARFSELTPVYQVSVWDADKGIEAKLVVEGQDRANLGKDIWKALKKEASEFASLPDFGCPFEIEVVASGAIPRMGRTGKIRPIIDLRGQA